VRSIDLPWGLGRVSPLSAQDTCDWIMAPKQDAGSPHILGNVNLHALHLALHDGPVRTLTGLSDVVLIDGWPVLQLARLVSPPGSRPGARERIGSTDWLEELIARDPEMRVVAVGGTPETAERMAAFALDRTTSLQWRAFDGYEFRERGVPHDDETGLMAALGRADLVLVGLGMPTQEAWILENLEHMSSSAVVANVGGCFDYFAGTQKLAPRWMGRLGLEWVFRLVHSPRRLAGRYLIEPWSLAGRLVNRRIRNGAERGAPERVTNG